MYEKKYYKTSKQENEQEVLKHISKQQKGKSKMLDYKEKLIRKEKGEMNLWKMYIIF